jgi:hypothetical protein
MAQPFKPERSDLTSLRSCFDRFAMSRRTATMGW